MMTSPEIYFFISEIYNLLQSQWLSLEESNAPKGKLLRLIRVIEWSTQLSLI